jgi:hypothetical protein
MHILLVAARRGSVASNSGEVLVKVHKFGEGESKGVKGCLRSTWMS